MVGKPLVKRTPFLAHLVFEKVYKNPNVNLCDYSKCFMNMLTSNLLPSVQTVLKACVIVLFGACIPLTNDMVIDSISKCNRRLQRIIRRVCVCGLQRIIRRVCVRGLWLVGHSCCCCCVCNTTLGLTWPSTFRLTQHKYVIGFEVVALS